MGPIDLSVYALCSAGSAAPYTLLFLQFLLGQSNWVSTHCARQVTLRRIHCCFFNLEKSRFKHFVISQKLWGQSTWVSTHCAQQVALRHIHCCFFNLQKSRFKHFVISQKLLGQSNWVSTHCARQVALRRIHCCFFNLKNHVLNILSYLRNYWANRPECQRIVLGR